MQLFDENGMLIIRDPSLLIKPRKHSNADAWSKRVGDIRVCKSCGANATGKPLESCVSTRHRSYYNRGLERHRNKLNKKCNNNTNSKSTSSSNQGAA